MNDAAQYDFELLLNALTESFETQLVAGRAPAPQGACVTTAGDFSPILLDADAPLTASELIDQLMAGFTRMHEAGELRSWAIAFDAEVTPPNQETPVDALVIWLEHGSGQAVDHFIPYRVTDGQCEYAEAMSHPRSPRVFV